MLKRFSVLLFIALTLSCTAAYKLKKKEAAFRSTVSNFNTELRWQRFSKAGKYVKEDERDRFLEYYENGQDTYQIMDVKILSARLDKKDQNKGQAKVWVTYVKYPNTTLQKTLRMQEWSFDPEKEEWTVTPTELAAQNKTSND